MRRIFLLSLLAACVLGLPRGGEEWRYDEDQCFLDTHFYWLAKTSEKDYRRFRAWAIENINDSADHIEDVNQRYGRNRDFRYWSPFNQERYQSHEDVELSYKSSIATLSQAFSLYNDIFHSFISLPSEAGYEYQYKLAWMEKHADELVSQLSEGRYEKQKWMKDVVKLIKPDTWPYLASCLYEAFRENQDSSTLSKLITVLVSEKDFKELNGDFERYVGPLSNAVRNVLESRETIEMIQLIYELTKSEIRAIDYNSLQPTLYYFVLQLKTVLMKPDIKELYATLNQTDYFIKESFWKYETGRWPEMDTFNYNFMRETLGKEEFWDRLPQQFIPEMVKETIPMMRDELKNWLEENDFDDLADINMEEAADTFFEKLTSIMEMVADGDEASLHQLFEDIRGSKWDEIVISYIETIADKLTSCNLATLASHLPSYDDIKSTITNNDFLQPIKTLLFNDWPQDEIYPESIDDFVGRIYDTRHSIFEAIFGKRPCDDDVPDEFFKRIFN